MSKQNNQKNNRKTYSIEEKLNVINFKERNRTATIEFLKEKFKMPAGTISNILKNKEKYSQKFQNKNKVLKKNLVISTKTKEIKDILFNWFVNQRALNRIISNDALGISARKIAEDLKIKGFKSSYSWIKSFKEEYKIKDAKICGEEGLVDDSVLINASEEFFEKLKKYNEKDIFNADETALFFKFGRDRSLVLEKEKISGKFSKERCTILFCSNMIGEKLRRYYWKIFETSMDKKY